MERSNHTAIQSGTGSTTGISPAAVDPFSESQKFRSLLLLILMMYIVGVAGWNAGLRFSPLPIVNLVLIGLAAVIWRPRSYTSLMAPLLGLGAALAIATLASPIPVIEGLIYWAFVALGYWFMSNQHPALLELALWLYFIAVGISGLLETVYMSAVGGEIIRPGSIMGNPNELGFVLIIALAVGVKRLQDANGRGVFWTAAGVGMLALLLLLTGSRSSWFGAGVGTAVFLALMPAVRRRLFKPVPLIALGVTALALSPLVLNQLSHSTHGLLEQRVDLWRGGLEAFFDRPLLGYGPWTFIEVYRPRVVHPWKMFHSHNLILNLGAETGLAGLAALGWLLGTAWQVAQRRALLVAFMAAVLAASLLDYTFWLPGAGLCTLAGWQVLAPEQKPYPAWGRAGFVLLALSTAAAFASRL